MTEKLVVEKQLYYRYIQINFNLSIKPIVVGFEKCLSSKPRINSKKTCYIMHLIFDGQGSIKYDDDEYTVDKNTIFILPPNANATYIQDKKDPWSYLWFEFNGECVKKILEKINFSNKNFIFKLKDFDNIKQNLIEKINNDYNNMDQMEELIISSFIMNILIKLCEEFSIKDTKIYSKKELLIKNITTYIAEHCYEKDFSLEKVAKTFFFTQPYFTRLFKNEMNITPTQYITDLKMTRAADLVDHKSFPIQQIADVLGYENQFYFSKSFKKYFGVCPKNYKKNNK